MKLSDYVSEFIAGLGVKHVFLLPGGGAMHLNDSFGKQPGLEYICNLHEQACAISADAYGQYTNNIGVCQVTTGPGGTNALTGVAAAWLDSTPCLFISGQVKRADLKGDRPVRQIGFQEIDIVAMARPITKYAVTVTDPESVRFHLEKAVTLARTGRPGPVWIDLPLDVQAAQIEPEQLRAFSPDQSSVQVQALALDAAVDAAIELLLKAERPVILAGNGVRLGRGLDGFKRLIERLQIPVLLTWKAIDFLGDDHPLYCGRPGGTGQRGANFTQQNADFLLILGARLDAGQTAYNHANFARGATRVMVDVDPAEIDKMQTKIHLPVPFDAGHFIAAMTTRLDSKIDKTPKAWSPWLARARAWHTRYPLCLSEFWARTDFVDNYVLVEVLSELMTNDDLLVPGSSGQCSEITMQAFKVKAGQRILNSEGLGPMGFGIAAPIGACLASGGKRTVSIDGDGGFIMNVQELETIRRLNLPIKVFVLNNNGYGSIRSSQRAYFSGRYVASEPGSGLTLPNLQKIVESYALPFSRIETHARIREQVAACLDLKGPAICEVMIFPDQATQPRVTSRPLVNGSFASNPMEDMSPLLDRDEFHAQMIVPPVD